MLQGGRAYTVATMKKLLIVLIALAGAYVAYEQAPTAAVSSAGPDSSNARLLGAIAERRSGYQVAGYGTVMRTLADDNDGSRHQRFIVRLGTGHTLLIAHNIDLAPRVAGLEKGDEVAFFGEYEWNERGGVIHWTHHDPRAEHVNGWIEVNGRRYQ